MEDEGNEKDPSICVPDCGRVFDSDELGADPEFAPSGAGKLLDRSALVDLKDLTIAFATAPAMASTEDIDPCEDILGSLFLCCCPRSAIFKLALFVHLVLSDGLEHAQNTHGDTSN